MNKLTHAALATCLLLGTASGFAQDSARKPDTKKDASAADCKAHTNTAKGQKATDPSTADTDKKCGATSNRKDMKMNNGSMKKNSTSPMGAASAP